MSLQLQAMLSVNYQELESCSTYRNECNCMSTFTYIKKNNDEVGMGIFMTQTLFCAATDILHTWLLPQKISPK